MMSCHAKGSELTPRIHLQVAKNFRSLLDVSMTSRFSVELLDLRLNSNVFDFLNLPSARNFWRKKFSREFDHENCENFCLAKIPAIRYVITIAPYHTIHVPDATTGTYMHGNCPLSLSLSFLPLFTFSYMYFPPLT